MSAEALPPGQRESKEFPRFGLGKFARRFPANTGRIEIKLRGDVDRESTLGEELLKLPRAEQRSNFHCVTTWSVRDLHWSGFRFADFYRELVVPQLKPAPEAKFVVFRGQDHYCSGLPLDDLLAADVLLADRLNGEPLDIAHGAPLRLIAPAHYGYKNVKHIAAIEFWRDRRNYRFPQPYPRFMDHPRARVALEERGRGLPGWVFRYLYRPLVKPTIRNFANSLAQHLDAGAKGSGPRPD